MSVDDANPVADRLPYRIGQGLDVHAFGEIGAADSVLLGGVSIPSDRPFVAHSDGDVLLHALVDALLGAIGQGDIGQHFPIHIFRGFPGRVYYQIFQQYA